MKANPLWQPETHQKLFRCILTSMARPGEVMDTAGILHGQPAYVGVLAALLDGTVTLSDPHGLLHEDMRKLLEAPVVNPEDAQFVLADAAREPDFHPLLGDLANPEMSATLVLVGRSVGSGDTNWVLRGPGVRGERTLQVEGFSRGWLARRELWVADFPLGTDMILVDGGHLAALPRTTYVEGR